MSNITTSNTKIYIIDDEGKSNPVKCNWVSLNIDDNHNDCEYIDFKPFINAELSFPMVFSSGRKHGKSKESVKWAEFFSKYYLPTLEDKDMEFKNQQKQEPFYRTKENFKRWSR